METKEEVERLHFEHWSVTYTGEHVFPYGFISLRPKREEVMRAEDLTHDERHELFDVAVRRIETFVEELFRPELVWEEWVGRSFLLIPLNIVRHPHLNRRVLTAHAA